MSLFNISTEVIGTVRRGYFYHHLPEKLQPGYDVVAAGIQSFQKRIQVSAAKSKEDMKRIIDAVIYDNPMLFYLNPREFSVSSMGKFYAFVVDYIYDKKRAAQVSKEIEEQADYILSQFITDDMSDYDKCLAIHDYMTENIRYNFSAVSVSYVYDAFTVEGAILKHQAVCEGIAKAISLLLGKLGIPCIVVQGVSDIDGEEIGHAWNIVELNQKHYHMDATWDLQEVNHFTSRSHMYMNLDDESMLMNHTWELQDYPTCNFYLENYYVKEKRYFRTLRSFELYVQRFLHASLTYMDVRFEDTLALPNDKGKFLAEIIQKEARRIGKPYQSSYLFNSFNYVFQAEIRYQ